MPIMFGMVRKSGRAHYVEKLVRSNFHLLNWFLNQNCVSYLSANELWILSKSFPAYGLSVLWCLIFMTFFNKSSSPSRFAWKNQFWSFHLKLPSEKGRIEISLFWKFWLFSALSILTYECKRKISFLTLFILQNVKCSYLEIEETKKLGNL